MSNKIRLSDTQPKRKSHTSLSYTRDPIGSPPVVLHRSQHRYTHDTRSIFLSLSLFLFSRDVPRGWLFAPTRAHRSFEAERATAFLHQPDPSFATTPRRCLRAPKSCRGEISPIRASLGPTRHTVGNYYPELVGWSWERFDAFGLVFIVIGKFYSLIFFFELFSIVMDKKEL